MEDVGIETLPVGGLENVDFLPFSWECPYTWDGKVFFPCFSINVIFPFSWEWNIIPIDELRLLRGVAQPPASIVMSIPDE